MLLEVCQHENHTKGTCDNESNRYKRDIEGDNESNPRYPKERENDETYPPPRPRPPRPPRTPRPLRPPRLA